MNQQIKTDYPPTVQDLQFDSSQEKRKTKNFKTHSKVMIKKNDKKQKQIDQFTNPIYAGFQQEDRNKQMHNFGPWTRDQLNSRLSIRKKISKVLETKKQQIKITFQNQYQLRHPIQLHTQKRNYDRTFRTPNLISKAEKYELSYPKVSLPQLRQTMKWTKLPDNTKIQQSKQKKITKSKYPNYNSEKKLRQYWQNQPNQYPNQMSRNPEVNYRKISNFVYNYCYDDEMLNLKLNPQQRDKQNKIQQNKIKRIIKVSHSLLNYKPKLQKLFQRFEK